MMPKKKRWLWCLACLLVLGISGLLYLSGGSHQGESLCLDRFLGDDLIKSQVVDRYKRPLSVTYQNKLNFTNNILLHDVPELLVKAFIEAEDKRFFEHSGVDWKARFAALYQNLTALRVHRGASTISEQVVRIVHPRKRTIWARWLEGQDAELLEKSNTKAEILEFYLNQVPYAANRRGVVQAASYYFDRDLSTLTPKEMLALVVMVRRPGAYLLDAKSQMHGPKEAQALNQGIGRLAAKLLEANVIGLKQFQDINEETLRFQSSGLPIEAAHFVRFIADEKISKHQKNNSKIDTTLDGGLQAKVESLLKNRLAMLKERDVNNAAVVVIDHLSGEILAWVSQDLSGKSSDIDAVLVPRQAGSTLKPFLYALALDNGWTAATIIDDAPIAHSVGSGLHNYRNYSRQFYGPLRLREALGNSLNTPAVRTVGWLGVPALYDSLHRAGFSSLNERADYYGEGLALGNAEVSLYELARAYSVLAEKGIYHPLKAVFGTEQGEQEGYRVFSEESASIIGDILSDPAARSREFGRGGVLKFPVQTAVKTGTSNDYRDAWAIGYSDRHTVGVWFGNLDRSPMKGVTGAIGPALVLRSVFAELRKTYQPKALYMSPNLVEKKVCTLTGKIAGEKCPTIMEWFIPGTEPAAFCDHQKIAEGAEDAAFNGEYGESKEEGRLRIILPTPGLSIAMDPRIPDQLEAISFVVKGDANSNSKPVEWFVDGKLVGESVGGKYLWQLFPGRHNVQAKLKGSDSASSQVVGFVVR